MTARIGVVPGIALSALPAAGDDIIWDNCPSGAGPAFVASQVDTTYAWECQAADDFLFDGPGQPWAITGVQWVGQFWNPPGHVVFGEPFNIYIYGDDGSGGSPTLPPAYPSNPGSALGVYQVLYPTEQPLGDDRVEYYVDLDVPFVAEPGVKYWMTIQWESVFPPQWGFVGSLDQQAHTAMRGFPILGVPYWSDTNPPMDLAFRLTGYEVPEPGSVVLLTALACAALPRPRPKGRRPHRGMVTQ